MILSNSRARLSLGILAGWIIASAVMWSFGGTWFAEVDEITLLSVSSLLLISSIALGGILLLVLGIIYKFTSSMGKVWALLAIGMLLWLVGEIIYYIYDVQASIDPLSTAPFPSVADAFYYVAYLPLAVGLIIQMRLLKLSLAPIEKILVIVLTVAASVVIMLFVLWPAIQALLGEGTDEIGIFAGSLYPVLDIVLLSCVFTVSAKLRHGKINSAWLLILIGLVLTTVADSLYWIAYSQGIDEIFNWYDFAFLASYIIIAMGAIKGINVISTSFSS